MPDIKEIDNKIPKGKQISDKPCKVCGKHLTYQQVWVNKGGYCSRNCANKIERERILRGEKRDCRQCGKEMYVSPFYRNTRYYCSIECRDLSQSKKVSKDCLECGKEYSAKPSLAARMKYCSRKCRYKAMVDKRNPNRQRWLKQNLAKSGLIKKCERCGFDKHPEILQVHHKDRDPINNILDNLEILCPNCHAFEHRAKPINGITMSEVHDA